MKKTVKALLLVLTMACSLLTLAACGGQGGSADTTVAAGGDETTLPPGYTVKVVDAFGNPVTEGVIVMFLQGGQQVAMDKVNAEGIVSKELADGEYTAKLKLTGNSAVYYDETKATLTAENKYLEIVLYSAIDSDPVIISAPSLKTQDHAMMSAYNVEEGGTYVELEAGERNYFIFVPTRAGQYAIKVHNTDATVGVYGVTHAVQSVAQFVQEDGSALIEILPSNIGNGTGGTTDMVIGIDATGADTTAVLTIERIGDHVYVAERDDPFEVYEPKCALEKYTLPKGTKVADFDVKAPTGTYNLVLGTDGFYHLDTEDGPLVLVKLGEASGGAGYLPALEEMATKSQMCKYFYDDNGAFITKETYNQCVQTYAKVDEQGAYLYMDDASGLYPLNDDLMYIIQMRGDHCGWFEEANTKHGYIFLDEDGNPVPGINNEISWLVMCCYIQN